MTRLATSRAEPRSVDPRLAFRAAAVAAVAAAPPAAASENFFRAPDVVILVEPSLAPAMRALGGRFRATAGAPVDVFAAPGFVLMGEVAHHARCDLLVLAAPTMDKAAAANLIRPETRIDGFATKLVIAAASGPEGTAPASTALATPALIARLLGAGRFACPDPTKAAAIDSAAVLARAGLAGTVAGRTIGGALNADIVHYLQRNEARLGLLYLADVRAAGLVVAASLPAAPANTARFSAALVQGRLSRNARSFLDSLQSPEARATLDRAGVSFA